MIKAKAVYSRETRYLASIERLLSNIVAIIITITKIFTFNQIHIIQR